MDRERAATPMERNVKKLEVSITAKEKRIGESGTPNEKT